MNYADYDMTERFIGLMHGDDELDALVAIIKWTARENNVSTWQVMKSLGVMVLNEYTKTMRKLELAQE